jgi:hypothetical protein
MNLIIGKIGKSILFDREKWGAIGGDNEAPLFYQTLFKAFPQHTFYIAGKSDFSRISNSLRRKISPHNNVIDLWDKGKKELDEITDFENEDQKLTQFVLWKLNKLKVKIDQGLFFAGPVGSTNCYGYSTLIKSPDVLGKPLEMIHSYVSPIVYFINESKLKYDLIVNDPRYYPWHAKDIFVPPRKILSQFAEDSIVKCKESYTSPNIIEVPTKCEYGGVEKIFLLDNHKEESSSLEDFFGGEDEPLEKDINFLIVCNEGKPSRYPMLKEFVLDKVKDVDIYGSWNEETIKGDLRFKGSLPFNDLHKMLPRIKFTFCIPIKKGWLTAKFWEMIHHGIIPFFHPTYDTQNNLGLKKDLRDFLVVKNSEDLFKKIDLLNGNDKAYIKLKTELESYILPEYKNGEYFINIVKDLLK